MWKKESGGKGGWALSQLGGKSGRRSAQKKDCASYYPEETAFLVRRWKMSLTKREKEVISRGSLPKTNSVCFCAEHGDPVFFCSDNVDLLRILYGKNTEEFEPYAPNFEALNHMLEAAVKNPNIGIRVGSEGQVVFNEEEKSGIEKELQIVSY